MANAVHRTTKEHRRSIHTPDFSPATWIINPDLSSVSGVPNKYWKITGDVITEMSAGEKATVDADEAAAALIANRNGAVAPVTAQDPEGFEIRALIELLNKRDNYLVNRITELQAAMDAMKASTGAVANMRDAIPASWLATNTRTRAEAITDYTDDINAGGADS